MFVTDFKMDKHETQTIRYNNPLEACAIHSLQNGHECGPVH
jgi:hypothetical protein